MIDKPNAESLYKSAMEKIQSLVLATSDNKENLFARLVINGKHDRVTIPGIGSSGGINISTCLSDILTLNAQTDEELNKYYNNSLEWIPYQKKILEIYRDILTAIVE